ncbi:MAG TPA: cyclic nucleotide-binding domain-containing protein [Acidimicrobiales bacterium]|nr:cyclic nucleotide-binding domain-containing protein [Acidimicrobiales bacterium]
MVRAMPKEILDMLHQVPLLSACNRAELRQVANLGAHVTAADKKLLTEQGKVGREFFLLLEGRANCYIDGTHVASFGPGDFFGEMALLRRGPRRANVVAEGPVKLLVLDGREFDRLMDASPTVARKVLVAIAAREEANANLYA